MCSKKKTKANVHEFFFCFACWTKGDPQKGVMPENMSKSSILLNLFTIIQVVHFIF